MPCLREMSGIGVGVGIEDLQQLSDRGDASAARMDVEKSMLLASLQDYNEKLVLEVTQLRDDNASLLDRVDEKDHLLQEREARFSKAKQTIDESIRLLKLNVISSLKERDEANERLKQEKKEHSGMTSQVRSLESSLSECKSDLAHQKQLVARCLRALAKHKVASTVALQEKHSMKANASESLEKDVPAVSSSLKRADDEEVEKELVQHMEVEHLLDTVGSTLQNKILSDKCSVLEKQMKCVNEILRDERDYRLLLEQRQSASQRSISQLISLLFVDKSESQRKKQLINSIVSDSNQSPSESRPNARGKRGMPGMGMRMDAPKSRASRERERKRMLDAQAIDALLDCNAEVESIRKSQFKLILNLLEDELHLLDMHYDRLLQEKERKKEDDTCRYIQSLIDRLLEEMKEKGNQVAFFSGILND